MSLGELIIDDWKNEESAVGKEGREGRGNGLFCFVSVGLSEGVAEVDKGVGGGGGGGLVKGEEGPAPGPMIFSIRDLVASLALSEPSEPSRIPSESTLRDDLSGELEELGGGRATEPLTTLPSRSGSVGGVVVVVLKMGATARPNGDGLG